jgi:hypothetical protein
LREAAASAVETRREMEPFLPSHALGAEGAARHGDMECNVNVTFRRSAGAVLFGAGSLNHARIAQRVNSFMAAYGINTF